MGGVFNTGKGIKITQRSPACGGFKDRAALNPRIKINLTWFVKFKYIVNICDQTITR
jgi:hypothetical protein